MEKKQKYKYNRKQELIINIISAIMVIMAVVVIVINILPDDDKSLEVAKPANTIVEEKIPQKEIGGIAVNQMTGTESESEIEQKPGEEDIKEAENTAENETVTEDTATVPSVTVKEYNNVACGRLEETKYVSSDYFDNTLFLGDSRTVALSSNGFIKSQNTFAVNGISHVTFLTQQFTDSVTGVTGDIFSIVKQRKPDRIYVALGVNGVAYIDKNTFLDKYEQLIDGLMKASPESKIIIQCILPVNEENYTGGNPNLNNKNIDAMNAELLNLAERKEIYYLDLSYILKNENNSLASIYDNGDGLHFSFTGYSAVYDGICRHGVD